MGGKSRDRTVLPRDDGSWANKGQDAGRASTVHPTQKEAVKAAHEMLKHEGGGELTIIGEDHRIRSKDTIPPGHDPRAIKDTEH